MKREKWILKVRNTLASLALECDTAPATECAQMTKDDITELQNVLMDMVKWIDNRLNWLIVRYD